MQMPMPVRLDADGQKNLDQSWDKALTPVERFDHPALLDVFLLTQAYQVGVDKLSFRSEKKVAVGTVVMEIEYDRLKPDEDRFEVKIYDPAGRCSGKRGTDRKEVEDAYTRTFSSLRRYARRLRRRWPWTRNKPRNWRRCRRGSMR